jgi:hypothetical protein
MGKTDLVHFLTVHLRYGQFSKILQHINVLAPPMSCDAVQPAREQDTRDKIQQEELSKRNHMLNRIRMRLVDKGIRGGEHVIAEVEDEFATGLPQLLPE